MPSFRSMLRTIFVAMTDRDQLEARSRTAAPPGKPAAEADQEVEHLVRPTTISLLVEDYATPRRHVEIAGSTQSAPQPAHYCRSPQENLARHRCGWSRLSITDTVSLAALAVWRGRASTGSWASFFFFFQMKKITTKSAWMVERSWAVGPRSAVANSSLIPLIRQSCRELFFSRKYTTTVMP